MVHVPQLKALGSAVEILSVTVLSMCKTSGILTFPVLCFTENHKTHFDYENTPIQIYLKISPPKAESFQAKILIFFIFLLNTLIVDTR